MFSPGRGVRKKKRLYFKETYARKFEREKARKIKSEEVTQSGGEVMWGRRRQTKTEM